MTVRSYLEVPTQDLARSPLAEGQTLPGLCVFGILAVFKRKPEGTDVWNNFDKAAKAKGSDGETLLSNQGVQVTHAKVVGKPKARRTVAPTDVPSFLAVVCGKSALPALEGQDLLETLVARGLDRDRAQALLAEQIQKLQEKPEDVATLAQVSQVFGTPLEAVRHMRTPKRNGEGTVFVMSAIDLVMAARGCDYAAARSLVFRGNIFHIFMDNDKNVMYRVQFPGQGNSSSCALTMEGSIRIIQHLQNTTTPQRLQYKSKDHLYIMQYSFDKQTVKIGRSFDVERRRKGLEACHNFRVMVLRIYHYHGFLEKAIHRKLHMHRSSMGPGQEWFSLGASEAIRIVSLFVLKQSRWVRGLKKILLKDRRRKQISFKRRHTLESKE
jgi:hypothetical protein